MPAAKLLKKKNNFFYLILFLSLFLFIIFIWLAGKVASRLYIIGQPFIKTVHTLCDCMNAILTGAGPTKIVFLIVLALGLTALSIWILIKFLLLQSSTKKFSKVYIKRQKLTQSDKLLEVIELLHLDTDIAEIDSPALLSFCSGFLKPKIVITNALVGKLTIAELRAVLQHEAQHCRSREPLKLFVIKFFRSVFFFIPGFKLLMKQYVILAELSADEKATNDHNDNKSLAGALYKVIQGKELQLARQNLALSFFGTVTEERINKLTDRNYLPRFRIISRKLGLSVIVIIISILLLNLFISSNNHMAMAENEQLSCETVSVKTHQCQMEIDRFCEAGQSSHICPLGK